MKQEKFKPEKRRFPFRGLQMFFSDSPDKIGKDRKPILLDKTRTKVHLTLWIIK